MVVKYSLILWDQGFHIFTNMLFWKIVRNPLSWIISHNGLSEALNKIRTKYWISKARNFISKIIRASTKCYMKGVLTTILLTTLIYHLHEFLLIHQWIMQGPLQIMLIFDDMLVDTWNMLRVSSLLQICCLY